MVILYRVSCTFLLTLLTGSAYLSGTAFLRHDWTQAAAFGALLLNTTHMVTALWLLWPKPGRHAKRPRRRGAAA